MLVAPSGDLTQDYIEIADAAAEAAADAGARVRKAYAPAATRENVLRAVRGANVVLLFGDDAGPDPLTAELGGTQVSGPQTASAATAAAAESASEDTEYFDQD